MKTRTQLLAATLLIFLVSLSCQKTVKPEPITEEVTARPPPPPPPPPPGELQPIQVYGVWHAGNDYCTWSTVRTVTEFDSKNHWIIDRGNG